MTLVPSTVLPPVHEFDAVARARLRYNPADPYGIGVLYHRSRRWPLGWLAAGAGLGSAVATLAALLAVG